MYWYAAGALLTFCATVAAARTEFLPPETFGDAVVVAVVIFGASLLWPISWPLAILAWFIKEK